KPRASVCQAVMAGRLSELEVSVPLWFDVLDEQNVLASWLADNLQDIAPRQGPESKVALAVGGLLAHGGLADFIQNFSESEAVFCIREVVETCQVGASHFVLTLGGVNASVMGFLCLFCCLQVRSGGEQRLFLFFGHLLEVTGGARNLQAAPLGAGRGLLAA